MFRPGEKLYRKNLQDFVKRTLAKNGWSQQVKRQKDSVLQPLTQNVYTPPPPKTNNFHQIEKENHLPNVLGGVRSIEPSFFQWRPC